MSQTTVEKMLSDLATKDAEIATLQYLLARADSAIQKAAMALDSTDEWVSQESMIADFESRLALRCMER